MSPAIASPYLCGAYAPIDSETTVEDLPTRGDVPRDLAGTYLRNGPNPAFAPKGRYHWFDGDGMVHGLHFEDGRVSYRSRWIRTAALRREQAHGGPLWSGVMESARDNPKDEPYKNTANTDILPYRGSALALWYLSGPAYRLDPQTLQTEGIETFGQDTPTTMSAHAKVDPRTGELFFFDYGFRPPFLWLGRVSADGRQVTRTPIELPGPRIPHDMALTERHAVLMDLPVVYDAEAMRQGRWVTRFDRALPARFAVVRRDGTLVRWFECEPCYVYHAINAWEVDDELVMFACKVDDPIPEAKAADGPWARMMANLRVDARLHRWRFNLSTGRTVVEPLDDLNTEFPSMDLRRLGVPSRFAYNMRLDVETTLRFDGIARYDLETGDRQVYAFGDGRFGSEAPFAPKSGHDDEGEGYLLSFVRDVGKDRSELVIFDAREVAAGPIATVHIPTRVPAGFHACFVPA